MSSKKKKNREICFDNQENVEKLKFERDWAKLRSKFAFSENMKIFFLLSTLPMMIELSGKKILNCFKKANSVE